ncbi:MAG: DUF5011 domain-containing protein, partial [Candidatus Kaiserbacteria bacterium]|nr:DUF5011 domain-containing protein [Candidatus Kaiserbacteria bacterium]
GGNGAGAGAAGSVPGGGGGGGAGGVGGNGGNGEVIVIEYTTNTFAAGLSSSGYFGIGTSSPSSALSVNGDATFGSVSQTKISDTLLSTSFGTVTNTPLYLMTNNTAGAVLTQSNRLGINLATNVLPRNNLDVNGGAVIGNAYAGASVAPTNGLLVQGGVGIGTTKASTIAGTVLTLGGYEAIDNAGVGYLYFGNTAPASIRGVQGSAGFMTFSTNGGEKVRIDDSGNLGIGTTSPMSMLAIAGTITANNINATSTTATSTFAGGLTVGTSKFVVDLTTGNVGIGTTSPTALLGLQGAIGVNSSQLYLAANGNIGIGTTTPTLGILDVNGNLAIENQGQIRFYPLNASPNYYASLSASSTMAGNVSWTLPKADGTTGQVLATNGVGNMYWTTSGLTGSTLTKGFMIVGNDSNLSQATSSIFISSTGNIGIGTTTPNWLLQVSGTQPSFALSDYSATSGNKHWLFSSMGGNLYIGTSTDAYATSSPSALTILNNGNIGVGTSSPTTYKFSVNGSASLGSGDEAMRVSSVGYVGIGTTSPYAKLSLVDTSAGLHDVFAISTSTSGLIFKVDSYGKIWADGGATITAADYAEYFYTNSVDLKPGETVCVDIIENNAVKRCERGADNNVMGIVSTKPAVVGNDTHAVEADPTHYAIIGMLGQVDALVSAENGPITVGDSLTSASSTPGYAMHAGGGDSTVAIALEPLAEGQGTIKVMISRRNKSLAVEEVEALVVERIANMKIEDRVQQLVKDATDNITLTKLAISGTVSAGAYETALASTTSYTFNSTVSTSSPQATVTAELPSDVLTADGEGVDLYKLATYNLSGLQALAAKIDAHEMRLASLEARVTALENGTISSAAFSTTSLASALNSIGVFISKGFAQFGTLVADQFVAATNSAGSSSAGTVTILAGNTVAQVNNAYVKPSSKIFVTFTASTTGSWYISDKQNGSFKLVLENAQTADSSFDYFLVQTEGQMATSTPELPPSALSIPSPKSDTTSLITTPPVVIASTPASGDTTPPVVTLISEAALQINVNGTFTDPGATATDDTDGDLTAKIVETGSVDVSTAGLYTLTYTATDAAGNHASVSRVVTVITPPPAPVTDSTTPPPAPPEQTDTTPVPAADSAPAE